MRFLTTLLLLVAAVVGGFAWHFWDRIAPTIGLRPPVAAASVSAKELERITAESLVGIEINGIRLEKNGTVWNMPGEWPTRTAEVNDLVQVLTNLHSRFSPENFNHPREFGLAADQNPVTVKATVKLDSGGTKTYTLVFGEPAGESANPFVRATYVHVDDQPDVLRLAPGLIQKLRKNKDDFLRRQLFPEVVRTKFTESSASLGGDNELPTPAIALLNATEVAITGPDGSWTLRRTTPPAKPTSSSGPITMAQDKLAASWELVAPVVDRVDPERLKSLLAAVPDLWVEAFLPEADLEKTGLDQPERTISVKSPDRDLKVLIGKVSRVKVTNPPPPPPPNPLAPPPPPPPPIREEFRYAKLPNNPQVFEIKADRFPELFVKVADLRDPRLARFRPTDVAKLEINGPERKLLFAKEKDGAVNRWKLLEPVQAPAEGPKVMELLDKLSALQARGDAVIDSPELKNYGLADNDPVTTISLTVRPDAKDGDEAKHETIFFRLGKADAATAKLYLQVAGVARIDAVADDLLKLVDRPILAYRSRRIVDVPISKVAKIAVERAADPFTLSQTDGKWSLSQPVAAIADGGMTNSLVADLANLDAADFVNFSPSADDLKKYGLDAPSLKVIITSSDGAERTVLFGNAREGKPEVYAKLSDQPEVFALRQTIKDEIDQPSLAFRPLQLWQVPGGQVQSIEIKSAAESFTLTRDGAFWKIAGPFSATAFLPSVQPLAETASLPRAERFETHGNDDLAKFGLDNPAITMRVTIQGERPSDPTTTKVILFGKPVADGQSARFAKLSDQPGVFVMGAVTSEAVSRPALELLDRKLLQMDSRLITKLNGNSPTGSWSARKDGDKWVIDSMTPPVPGDRSVIEFFVNSLADIRATKFAAYSPTDLSQFGLDQPIATITATLATGDQPTTHTIALGKPTPDNAQARFARVDNGPAIGVLPIGLSSELAKSGLDFVDRGMISFPPKDLVAIRRASGDQEMVLELKDGAWQIVKPSVAPADDPALFEMTERLANLRAVRVAALHATDLQPFGLDKPAATITLSIKQSEGPPRDYTLKIGNAGPDGRFAQVVGTDTIFVLPDSKNDPLATRLLADAVKFRDRTLVRFTDADRVVVTRGQRTATFAKVDGQWKMTAPISADAENFDLEDLVLTASRLRADELVAEQPSDLKSVGLDPPDTEFKFFQGDQQVAQLLVSAKADDGRATVKSGAGTLVGKLDKGLSARLLNEYRKRSLWSNLDVVQVDSIIINAGIGGTPLILTKDDAGWKVAGKPDQTVNVEAVSDFLSTLASLKAERFVADDKADLKLFGLDPPVRVVVVKTRSGQTTTLHLGRLEGDSKRAYASVPGAGWVAVLGEAESDKLGREVSSFVQK
jgi:hypothetical protein